MSARAASISFCLLSIFAFQTHADAKRAPLRIACITGNVEECPDEFYGAERFAREYGRAESGGILIHEVFSERDGFSSIAARIEKYAEDPSIRAIVASAARSGTAEGFRRARALRKDLVCIAVNSTEGGLAIESAASLAIGPNNAARGFLLAAMAKNAGLGTIVFASSEKSLELESVGLIGSSAEIACRDLGVEFARETLPDPSKGLAKGIRSAAEAVPKWLEKYGEKTLIFNAEDSYAEVLIGMILDKGGYYYEGISAPVSAGFSKALGIDASTEGGDPQKILRRVEQAILARGGAKRFGTWASSFGYASTAGALEFAKSVSEGKSKISSQADLSKAFAKHSSGLSWNMAYSTDPATGIRSGNRLVVFQDTYIFGMGFFPSTKQKIDPKYYKLGVPQ